MPIGTSNDTIQNGDSDNGSALYNFIDYNMLIKDKHLTNMLIYTAGNVIDLYSMCAILTNTYAYDIAGNVKEKEINMSSNIMVQTC